MSDELAATNRSRWNALVDANVEYAQPKLDLTSDSARVFLDRYGVMGDVGGKDVLCLASGGGQQSVAFALLGANVTVFDLSDKQLERDRQAAGHYGLTIQIVHGDMRHLDAFASASFDLVYQAFSINFVPEVSPVLAEVARVSRPGALVQLIEPKQDWNGSGYLLRHEYIDGREATEMYPTWTVEEANGSKRELASPREFVHTLSTMVNSLVRHGFVIFRAGEDTGDGREAPPGSWFHYLRVAAPYLTLWARYLPDTFARRG
jgi:ubiquinone/menaquinone biosynthesis C-methylase UbiE